MSITNTSNQLASIDKSLRNYFVIAYLIPIVVTILVTLIYGLPTELVTQRIDAKAVVVFISMVHAPLIAAMIVVFLDEGLNGIKNLFLLLKYWRFESKWYMRALLIFPSSILGSLLLLSFFSKSFILAFFLSILAFGSLINAFFEVIG